MTVLFKSIIAKANGIIYNKVFITSLLLLFFKFLSADTAINPNLAPCPYYSLISTTPNGTIPDWQGPKIFDLELDFATTCPGCNVKVVYYDRMIPLSSICGTHNEYQLNVSGLYVEGNCSSCSSEYIIKQFMNKIWTLKLQDTTFRRLIRGNNDNCVSSQTLYTKAYCKNGQGEVCDTNLRCCEKSYNVGPWGEINFVNTFNSTALATGQPFTPCPPGCNYTCFDVYRAQMFELSCDSVLCTKKEFNLLSSVRNVPIPDEPDCYMEVKFKTRYNDNCDPKSFDIRIDTIIRKGNCITPKPQNTAAYFAIAYQDLIANELSQNPTWLGLLPNQCFDEIRISNGACWSWSSSYNPPNSPYTPDTLHLCLRTACCSQLLRICKGYDSKPKRPTILQKSSNQIECVNFSYPCASLCYDVESLEFPWRPWLKKPTDEKEEINYLNVMPGIYDVRVADISGNLIYSKQIILEHAYNNFNFDYNLIKEKQFLISIFQNDKLIVTKKIIRD